MKGGAGGGEEGSPVRGGVRLDDDDDDGDGGKGRWRRTLKGMLRRKGCRKI